ncbi:unnamed protein product [Rotaria sp. Silwood1]|nr:unnamed protein product [Rotaria sp. Silwood1]
MLPGTDTIITTPLCNVTNPCYSQAVNVLLNSIPIMDKYCTDCSQQCLIINFNIQTSSLKTPLKWQLDGIKAFVENSSIPLPTNWSTTWRKHIYNNYLSLSVVRETSIVEINTQSSVLGLVDIVSNIGGQTGLWIGISFLSIMELIEMLYRLIRHEYHIIRESITRKRQVGE